MNPPAFAILVFLAMTTLPAAAQDVSRLLEKLKSTDPTEAEGAQRDLLEQGPANVPAIRQAVAKSQDAQFKKRAALVADRLEVRKGVPELAKRWGDRWYAATHVPKSLRLGWFHLKVEQKGSHLLLTDEFYAKVNQEQETRTQTSLTAQLDEFLTPVLFSHKHESAKATVALEIRVEGGIASIYQNGQRKQGEEGGGKLPSNFATDFALLRIVSLLPQTEGYPVNVLDTLIKAKTRFQLDGFLRFDREEEIDFQGRKVKTRVFAYQVEGFPGNTYWVDKDGRVLKFTAMGCVEAVLCDEKGARAIDAAALPPPPVVHTNPKRPSELPALIGIPIFPGAEGFGTRTKAGRGGKVIEVSSLADGGPGTLREALDDPNPRTIVFRVGGIIELKGELFVNQPFVTVAGQTAPGGGITIKDAGITITTHDVLIQHLRIRPGNKGKIAPDNNDAVTVLGPDRKIKGGRNVVLDHISASWAEDETVSIMNGAREVTLCWSIVSEGLNRSRHSKSTHSAGIFVGYGADHVSIHRNLLAHHGMRNPLISSGGTHDVVNNVIYDWGDIGAQVYDDSSNSFVNFIGNTFLSGPSSKPLPKALVVERNPKKGAADPRLFLLDNWGTHRGAGVKDEWAIAGYSWGEDAVPLVFRVAQPFKTWPITRSPAAEAKEQVLARAGATAPQRDAVDSRIVNEVKTGTGRIIDSPEQAGGFPAMDAGAPPMDSDHDGMPDEWERKLGLNPKNPSDGSADPNGNGYTNLEEYLHALAK